MSKKIIITPDKVEQNYWIDLLRFKDLFYILSWRDLKVRYSQTVLGIAWAIIRPVLTVLIFSFVFGRIARMNTQSDDPYIIVVFAGLLPWLFFSNSISEVSNSLISNERIVSKIYFPRIILPISSMATVFIDFIISLVLLAMVLFYFQYTPTIKILFLPVLILLTVVASIGPGIWLSALNVKYRDFRYVIPFIIQFGLFISPVGYISRNIPDSFAYVYYLNPMAGIIDVYRWCILKNHFNPFQSPHLYVSLSVSLSILIIGVVEFRKMERHFADII
jgi:lipopolysaccharide transport system permease protein